MQQTNNIPAPQNNEQPVTPASIKFDFNKYNIDADGIQQEITTLEKLAKGNVFPSEVFPGPVLEIIEATNKCLGFPIDFIGTALLYATSVAMGNTHRIQVKIGRVESGILYFALVGPPGTNKSHPLAFAVKPLRDKDEVSCRAY